MAQNNNQANGHAHSGFPWSHVFGFILSLALTFLALYVALYTTLPLSTVLTTIIIMAVAQALLQLIMFMHLKEGEGRVQILTMIYSFFVATATVGLTVYLLLNVMYMKRLLRFLSSLFIPPHYIHITELTTES